MDLEKLEKMLQLALEYKAKSIKLDSIEIELDDRAFMKELTPEELKEIYGENDNEEDILFHSAR